MDEQGGTELETGSTGLDRRRVLKGAVAAGVGVAVWSTPSITSVGGTPAYAAVCTQPILRFKVGHRNTSCDCNETGSGDKVVQYKVLGNPCNNDPLPVNTIPFALVQSGAANAPLVDNSGSCPPGSTGGGSGGNDAHARLGSNNQGLTCVVEVLVVQNNCGTQTLAEVYSGPVPDTGGSVPMPLVNCASFANNSAIFLKVNLICSTQSWCLPQ